MHYKFKTYTANTFSLTVTWELADGSTKDLTGATVEAFAKSGSDTVELSGTVSDGAAGEVRVSAPADALSEGYYDLQVRVTKSGITRTYATNLVVYQSLEAA